MTAAIDDHLDHRFMAAAIRLAERHRGLTATNPSVACLIVRDGIIIGRGVTAHGGRPHAETEALAEAGEGARGATAYVTLEPCAHHGRTPPCAEALVAAGIARVVGAAADPDLRVSGRGYAILRAAGIAVTEPVLGGNAAERLSGYMTRSVHKRPEVILKLAVSADGMIGRPGQRVAITGPVANAQVHLMRAMADVITVGAGTVLADDPLLTCRLPGLAARSPQRLVIAPAGFAMPHAAAMLNDGGLPVWLAGGSASGCSNVLPLATEQVDGHVALPELLDDLAARGVSTMMLEGGAALASAFLNEGLVDRIALFTAPAAIGPGGIAAPATVGGIAEGFVPSREAVYGQDRFTEWVRA